MSEIAAHADEQLDEVTQAVTKIRARLTELDENPLAERAAALGEIHGDLTKLLEGPAA